MLADALHLVGSDHHILVASQPGHPVLANELALRYIDLLQIGKPLAKVLKALLAHVAASCIIDEILMERDDSLENDWILRISESLTICSIFRGLDTSTREEALLHLIRMRPICLSSRLLLSV